MKKKSVKQKKREKKIRETKIREKKISGKHIREKNIYNAAVQFQDRFPKPEKARTCHRQIKD